MSPFEKAKRQQRWMLPVLAILFVLNFAAFVNGRLMPSAAAVTTTTLADHFVADGISVELRSNLDRDSYRIVLKNRCESDRRHVHVRTW